MYDIEMRRQKANKMLAVLEDYYIEGISKLEVLDIGCSTGIIANELSKKFTKVSGIDIDEAAVNYAKETYQNDNLNFSVQDSMNLKFSDQSFDVITCAHVYEHVPESNQLFSEIYRILKPEGICYFAAGNRLSLIEAHYKVPLLSIIPKPLAHIYLRMLKKGEFYYENHLTLWGLRKLVSQFEIKDYTLKVLKNPQKYYATEMVKQESLKQKLAISMLDIAYWLCPTYIWLLRKSKNTN